MELKARTDGQDDQFTEMVKRALAREVKVVKVEGAEEARERSVHNERDNCVQELTRIGYSVGWAKVAVINNE